MIDKPEIMQSVDGLLILSIIVVELQSRVGDPNCAKSTKNAAMTMSTVTYIRSIIGKMNLFIEKKMHTNELLTYFNTRCYHTHNTLGCYNRDVMATLKCYNENFQRCG